MVTTLSFYAIMQAPSVGVPTDIGWRFQSFLHGNISITMFCISSIEFLASQIPYSMSWLKIVLHGYARKCIHIHFDLPQLCCLLAIHSSVASTWATGIISCKFWYQFSGLFILVAFSGILLAVGRWYKNRKRDVLPNLNRTIKFTSTDAAQFTCTSSTIFPLLV